MLRPMNSIEMIQLNGVRFLHWFVIPEDDAFWSSLRHALLLLYTLLLFVMMVGAT